MSEILYQDWLLTICRATMFKLQFTFPQTKQSSHFHLENVFNLVK